MKKKIIFLVAAALMLNSCDDLFEPAIENFKDVEQMYDDAQYAQGFLVNVYRCVPGYYDNSEYATDDAVINQKNNAFLNDGYRWLDFPVMDAYQSMDQFVQFYPVYQSFPRKCG